MAVSDGDVRGMGRIESLYSFNRSLNPKPCPDKINDLPLFQDTTYVLVTGDRKQLNWLELGDGDDHRSNKQPDFRR